MKKLKNKKKTWGVLFAVVVIFGVVAFCSFRFFGNEGEEILYKETEVERGNLTVGVTESGSVTVGTITQDIEDLEDLEISNSQSSTGSRSQTATEAGAAGGFGNTASTGSSASTGLEVEEVYLSVGTVANVGDPILKLTAESVAEYKESLEDDCSSAERALKKAQLEAKTAKLNAQYNYNTNVTKGNVAQSEYDNTIAELQASVDTAQASVDASATKIAEYQKKIEKGEKCSAALAEEQANYNSMVSKLESAKNAQATKTVEAKQKYEETMLKYNNADTLYQIDTGDVDAQVEDAQDTLDEANEALTNFKSLIGDGIIYAQYTGTIASLGYAEGDTLSSSTEIATFTDASEVTMTVSVSQEDIASVQVGNEVEIALTAYEDKTYEGQVKTVDTSASSGTSTVSYDVTVVFTGDTSDVYQDMTGNVTFVASQAEDVCYVSRKAIIMDENATYLKVKRKDGTIEKVQVTTGISDGVNIEISEGVAEGDTVLIESQVNTK